MTNYNMLSYKMPIFLILLISQWNGVDSGPCEGAPPTPLSGICGEGHYRFYYRSQFNSCSSFSFYNCTGLGFYGNIMNNFMTLEECQNTCQNRKNDPTPTVVPPPDNADCTLPSDVGFINMSVIARDRYYYNATLGKCLQFIYSGIGGNANNFETEDQCNRVCYPGSPSTPTANMSSSSSFIDPGSPTAHMSSSSSGYLDATTFTLTVQTLPSSSGTTMKMINDLTDIYRPPSSTRQSSKTSSTLFVVSETSSPAKPINVYLYASIGVIVIIVLFLILASAVLISMYIWFKQAIVNDSSRMEAVAPSTSSAPWQPHAYLAVIRSNKSHNAVPCSPVSGSSSSSVDC